MTRPRVFGSTFAALAAALAIAACGGEETDSTTQGLPQGSEPVSLDPADFTAEIDNPYWPMKPGTRWTFRETDGEGEERTAVTSKGTSAIGHPPFCSSSPMFTWT